MFSKVLSLFKKTPAAEAGEEVEFRYLTKDKKNKRLKEIFSAIPRFETQRLVLRRIEEKDCDSMHEYSADAQVTKYLVWHPHATLVETRNYIYDIQKKYDNGKFYDWGLVYKPNGAFVGTCGFASIDINKNTCEVGYVLSQKYWGLGLMPEALERIVEFAFESLGFDKVEARFMEGNQRSKAVMEKAGMAYEKTERNAMYIKGGFKTVYTYSINREMFERRKIIKRQTI